MALEDIAAFRAIHGSTVLHPSDANQTAKLVAAMADREGISFIRTLRGKTEVRTPAGRGRGDRRLARRARGRRRRDRRLRHHASTRRSRRPSALAGDGIEARVIDCYSIKPIDAETLRAAARECGAIVTVEDHWPEGGLGDAVLEALAEADDRPPVRKLAVREMPTSGTPDELLHWAGIDADGDRGAPRASSRGSGVRRSRLTTAAPAGARARGRSSPRAWPRARARRRS